VRAALGAWAKHCPRPLVVLIDEIDALRDDVLVSVLRQLRAGYPLRPERFPWSVALVGLRDVRDHEVSGREAGRLGTASPFNIKVESLTLSNFTLEEIAELYVSTPPRPGSASSSRRSPGLTRSPGASPGWSTPSLARPSRSCGPIRDNPPR
jgi:hypothetical protein